MFFVLPSEAPQADITSTENRMTEVLQTKDLAKVTMLSQLRLSCVFAWEKIGNGERNKKKNYAADVMQDVKW